MEESELKLGLVSINNPVDLSDLMFCLRSSGTGCEGAWKEEAPPPNRRRAAAGDSRPRPGTGAATRLGADLRLLNVY